MHKSGRFPQGHTVTFLFCIKQIKYPPCCKTTSANELTCSSLLLFLLISASNGVIVIDAVFSGHVYDTSWNSLSGICKRNNFTGNFLFLWLFQSFFYLSIVIPYAGVKELCYGYISWKKSSIYFLDICISIISSFLLSSPLISNSNFYINVLCNIVYIALFSMTQAFIHMIKGKSYTKNSARIPSIAIG